MKKNKMEVLNKAMFYTLVFLVPVNLGYHFVLKSSYLNGLLIDYLIPTLYVQDLVAVVWVVLNAGILTKQFRKEDKFLVWFIFSVFLSALSSIYLVVSMVSAARLLLYVMVMTVVRFRYVSKVMFKKVTTITAVWTILLSLLAFLQWTGQGSVFDNYLFFGEQPYSSSTPGVNIENFFGNAKVPPYGTFRHPNVLGGILSIVLIWFLFDIKEKLLFKISFILGLVALFLTLSKFSWLSFLLGAGLLALFKLNNNKEHAYKVGLGVAALIIVTSLQLPFTPNIKGIHNKPSFYRRAHLLRSSYHLISQRPLFGTGYGASTAYMDKYLPPKHDIRFAQPVHNILVLLLVEGGVFSLLFFSLYLFKKVRKSIGYPVMFVTIVQVVFLGMFDHYFFTIHQPQLLLWLILGFI